MPYRPKDIYRGRRKFRVPLTILLFVLAFLLVGGVTMFYVLQRYMVYDADGATLQLPFGREEQTVDEAGATPKPTFEPVQVQVIWEDPDYEDVDLGGWEELKAEQGWFIPMASVINPTDLAGAVATVEEGSYTTAILEMKDRSGQLVWPSTSSVAMECATYGATDVMGAIEQLHEAGKTVAAQISCFCDTLLVQRNWACALQSGAGGLFVSDEYFWLDPYNSTVRTYLAELALELSELGFDEVILADLYLPVTEEGYVYSVIMQTDPDPIIAVCQAGRRVAEALAGTDTAVSVRLNADSLRQGLAAQTGQDVAVFWKLFARLYCPTTTDMIASDRETAAAVMESGSTDVRFVPVLSAAPENEPSYVVSQAVQQDQ